MSHFPLLVQAKCFPSVASIWNNGLFLKRVWCIYSTLEQRVPHFTGCSNTGPPQLLNTECERRLLTSRCPKLQAKRNCGWGGVSARRNKPSDDAAASPHQSDGAVVEGPAKLYGRLPQQHEALSVGDDLWCVEGLRKNQRKGWKILMDRWEKI